jgi:hypothetical protein
MGVSDIKTIPTIESSNGNEVVSSNRNSKNKGEN